MSFGMITQNQFYGEKAKLCCMNTDRFLVYIKTKSIYVDIAKHVKTRFGASNELKKPLPRGKTKSVIDLMKDEFGLEIMTEFFTLRQKIYETLKHIEKATGKNYNWKLSIGNFNLKIIQIN